MAGFLDIKKVDILWKDESNHPKGSSGELFLRVSMSEKCDKTKFWSILTNHSLRIRNIIDWDRSHPDDFLDYSDAYGIDIAWQYFVNVCFNFLSYHTIHITVSSNSSSNVEFEFCHQWYWQVHPSWASDCHCQLPVIDWKVFAHKCERFSPAKEGS